MIFPNVKRAAIYARISEERPGVDKVENQVSALQEYATKRGYTVIQVFRDNNLSAYKGRVLRPGFMELIEGLKANKFDVVLVTELSRLTRGSSNDLNLLSFWCSKASAVIDSKTNGIHDPSKSMDKAMLSLLDVFYGMESDTRIERQRARNRADISKGLPTKGLRPFGWKVDRITIEESEAKHVREAIRSVIKDGATTWQIAQRWNALGLKTPAMTKPRTRVKTGKKELPSAVWTTTAVRQILVRPRNAGLLVHQGEEMPNSLIQPIVSRAELEEVQGRIKGTPVKAGPKPKYLLGGLMDCPCGQKMYATTSVTQRKGKPKYVYKMYRCRLYGFDRSQKHVSVQMSIAEAAVRDVVVSDIGLGFLEPPATSNSQYAEAQSQQAVLVEQKRELTGYLIEGVADKSMLRRKLVELDDKIRTLESDMERILADSAFTADLRAFAEKLSELNKDAAFSEIDEKMSMGHDAWDALPMSDKRSILKSRYRIQVNSGGRGLDRIDVALIALDEKQALKKSRTPRKGKKVAKK